MGGHFPRGRLNADDEGQTAVAMGVRDKTVILQFFKPITWIGLDKATALDLAAKLKEHAESIT